MNRQLYRIGIRLVPSAKLSFSPWTGPSPGSGLQAQMLSVLREEKVRGGALAVSDGETVSVAAFGQARRDGSLPASCDTFFRTASVSKFVTAYAVLLLEKKGLLSLTKDIGDYLGFPVRNPAFPEKKITLSMLLSHTSSIRDGESYLSGLSACPPVTELLQKDCFAPWAPGEKWDYSNLAAGLIGCVLEGALKKPFQQIMEETLFAPLKIAASFCPSQVPGPLADCWRLFPPSFAPNYDGRKQKLLPAPAGIDLRRDYLMAHGRLCVCAGDLLEIARSAAQSDIFPRMILERASFGARDRDLCEGLGTFLYRHPGLPEVLYGHQGLAYGAVNGLFINARGEGFALLTSAASEERMGVMTSLNKRMCETLFPQGRCRPW